MVVVLTCMDACWQEGHPVNGAASYLTVYCDTILIESC